MELLKINNLNFGYDDLIIKNFNLTIKDEECVALLGKSGIGKSTLLKLILGFDKERIDGEILFYGRNIKDISNLDLRKNIGIVFQDSKITLSANQTIGQNIMLYGMSYDYFNIKDKALRYLEMVGLDDVWYKYPYELSGGMAQRVGIVMAILIDPKLVLFDEPLSALDVVNQSYILKIIKELNCAKLFVSHDEEVAKKIADKIVYL